MNEFYAWVESTGFSTWVRESGSLWSYPIVLTLHTVGLALLVGFNWAVDFRLLGFAESIPLASMGRYFAVMWFGFWINLLSGIVLLMADATTKMTSWVFGVKMVFIVIGMVVLRKIQTQVFIRPKALANMVSAPEAAAGAERPGALDGGVTVACEPAVLTKGERPGALDGGVAVACEPAVLTKGEAAIPDNAKVLAIFSLVCWVMATTAGRLMAYLGPQVGLIGPQVK